MKLISSWDDGTSEDVGLAKMLKAYKIPSIFFIPNTSELSEEFLKQLVVDGFEVGGHTVSHPNDLKVLPDELLRREIFKNKEDLEKITGQEITKFCYPSGRYNEKTIEVLKEAGYTEARTTLVGNYKQPEDPFRISTSAHVYPHRKEYCGKKWHEFATEMFNKAIKNDGVFHLWGHSLEITKFSLWEELEEFFEKINENPNWKRLGREL